MSDLETIAVYNEKVKDYVRSLAPFASKDPLIDEFIAVCPRNGRVLDLGSGPGAYAERMATSGLYVDAVDASSEMIRHVPIHPRIRTQVATFDAISAHSIYDGVWAYFSLLHASRAAFERHLHAIQSALKPKAVFFLAMKVGQGYRRDTLGRYYEYYAPDELKCSLTAAGLAPRRRWTGVSVGLSGESDHWIALESYA